MLRISAAKRRIDGLWVGSYYAENAEPALRRVEEALHLIKTYERPRYDRMLRDLDRIWVRLILSGAGNFDAHIRACSLDERFVLDDTTDAEMIAGAIVHEATHARLWRYGFRYEENRRERVEAICYRRMLAFARKLPDGRRVREWAEAGLAQPRAYWSDAAMQEHRREGMIQILRHLDAKWIARLLLVIERWRQDRARRRGSRQT